MNETECRNKANRPQHQKESERYAKHVSKEERSLHETEHRRPVEEIKEAVTIDEKTSRTTC